VNERCTRDHFAGVCVCVFFFFLVVVVVVLGQVVSTLVDPDGVPGPVVSVVGPVPGPPSSMIMPGCVLVPWPL
jgi:hypothetical protein